MPHDQFLIKQGTKNCSLSILNFLKYSCYLMIKLTQLLNIFKLTQERLDEMTQISSILTKILSLILSLDMQITLELLESI
jgi:hypothetical protein